MAWLEPPVPAVAEEVQPPSAPPSSRRKPPRVPGASRTLPPMPLLPSPAELEAAPPSPRNHTMEVELNWVELIDEKTKREETARAAGEEPREDKARADVANEGDALTKKTDSVHPSSGRPPRSASVGPPSRRPSRAPSSRPMPIEEAMKPRTKSRKPIPREE